MFTTIAAGRRHLESRDTHTAVRHETDSISICRYQDLSTSLKNGRVSVFNHRTAFGANQGTKILLSSLDWMIFVFCRYSPFAQLATIQTFAKRILSTDDLAES